jgi:hypothetical protein
VARAALVLGGTALLLVALLFAPRGSRDDAAVVTPIASITVSPRTALPSPTPAPTLSNVPAACASLVRGTAFADGTLDERARAAQSWMGDRRGQTASIVITEDILNDAASRAAREEPVRDVRVTIDPEGFRLAATAVFIASFPIRVLLVPSATAGRLRVDIRELDTNGLPGLFRGQVEDALRRATDPAAWGIDMRVDGIATANGCAVIWGTV